MRKIFLHLGLYKTATKYLQEIVFPQIEEIEFLRKEKYERELLSPLQYQDWLAFDGSEEKIRENIFSWTTTDKPLLLSNELFSGNIFFQSYNRYPLLKKLKAIFPEAKILLTVRGQRHMIDSIYREYVSQGGCDSLNSFVKPHTTGSILNLAPALDLESLKYSKYLDAITDMFAKENCCFLPYELLLDNWEEYLRKIFNFLGTDADIQSFTNSKKHLSIGNGSVKWLRLANKFFYSAMHHRGILPHSMNIWRRFLSSKAQQKTALFLGTDGVDFNADNKYIDEKYNLDLKGRFQPYYFV